MQVIASPEGDYLAEDEIIVWGANWRFGWSPGSERGREVRACLALGASEGVRGEHVRRLVGSWPGLVGSWGRGQRNPVVINRLGRAPA